MALLLVIPDISRGAAGRWDEELIKGLLDEEDQVRIVTPDKAAGERWRAFGTYIAYGSADDPDLIERAALGVRTVVLLVRGPDRSSVVAATLEGMRNASVDRLVLCAPEAHSDLVAMIERTGFEYILLELDRGAARSRFSERSIAGAINAADDLSGSPRWVLDLAHIASWRRLGLDFPR